MGVQIDEARSDIESASIDNVECPIGCDVCFDGSNFAIQDRDVGSAPKPAARVAYLAVLDQDVITLNLLGVGQRRDKARGT